MIELAISSPIMDDRKFANCEILHLFDKLNIEAQLIQTESSVKDLSGKMVFEKGYIIRIFNYNTKENFKNDIWIPLQKKFNLICGHIKVNEEYTGCILNWPGVFTPSNCPVID